MEENKQGVGVHHFSLELEVRNDGRLKKASPSRSINDRRLKTHESLFDLLGADTVVQTKLSFKLVRTTGHCRTVHGKLLIVLDLLVTTTSTYKLVRTNWTLSYSAREVTYCVRSSRHHNLYRHTGVHRNTDLVATLKQQLGKLVTTVFVCLFVGCLTSQQHASVSQGRICSDNFTCCHTETEVADQTFHLTQSQYTDTGPTSPSTDPITPGAWQGSHWSGNV